MADWFTRAFGQGIDDVRAKLMEGWFGRDPDQRKAQDLGWSHGDHPGSSNPHSPHLDPDLGIDR